MGYPMHWARFRTRNQILGGYENGLIAGDAQRLRDDTLDDLHIAMYATVAGISHAKARKLLTTLFSGDVWSEAQRILGDDWEKLYRKHYRWPRP